MRHDASLPQKLIAMLGASKRPLGSFLVLVTAATLLRYQVVHQINAHQIYAQELSPDELVYQKFSDRIRSGEYRQSPLRFSPTPAFIYALFGSGSVQTTKNIRIFNFVLGVVSCLLVLVLTWQIFGNYYLALLAMLLATLYRPLALYNATYLKTSLVVVFFALTIISFLAFLKMPNQPL